MTRSRRNRTALYRHIDAKGRLLYVGISKHPVARLSQHAQSSDWTPLIATITVEWFETRAEAERAEIEAIRAEQPKYNTTHALQSPPPVRVPRAKAGIERMAFSPQEAAEVLGCSRAWIYLRMDDGTIPNVKLGGKRLIRRQALEALLDMAAEGTLPDEATA